MTTEQKDLKNKYKILKDQKISFSKHGLNSQEINKLLKIKNPTLLQRKQIMTQKDKLNKVINVLEKKKNPSEEILEDFYQEESPTEKVVVKMLYYK
jgi:hypothetical protein